MNCCKEGRREVQPFVRIAGEFGHFHLGRLKVDWRSGLIAGYWIYPRVCSGICKLIWSDQPGSAGWDNLRNSSWGNGPWWWGWSRGVRHVRHVVSQYERCWMGRKWSWGNWGNWGYREPDVMLRRAGNNRWSGWRKQWSWHIDRRWNVRENWRCRYNWRRQSLGNWSRRRTKCYGWETRNTWRTGARGPRWLMDGNCDYDFVGMQSLFQKIPLELWEAASVFPSQFGVVRFAAWCSWFHPIRRCRLWT